MGSSQRLKFWSHLWKEYKGKTLMSVICIFLIEIYLLKSLDSKNQFVWSMLFFWFPYCHTLWQFMSYYICHELAFCDILWHMSYDMKCYKVWQYGYRKNLWTERKFQKKEKTEMQNWPLYFWVNYSISTPMSYLCSYVYMCLWSFVRLG